MQHAQLMKANGAVLLAPCLTGVACEQARPLSRMQTLWFACCTSSCPLPIVYTFSPASFFVCL